MKNFTVVIVLLAALILTGCSSSVDPRYSTFEQQTQVVISDMIGMLEQGRPYEIIDKYIDPATKDKEGAESIRASFTNEKQNDLLRALKIAQDIMPTVDSKSLSVTYSDMSMPGGRALMFQKIAGQWYLVN